MNSNQVVEVLADDPGFKNDIVVWCNRTHNELLLLTKNEDDVFIAFIEKAKE
jgi:TusA-related sulfurtransferase